MEIRGSIIAADQGHARRLDAAEEKYKATVARAAVAFEEACGMATGDLSARRA
jgi:hypothetical protein